MTMNQLKKVDKLWLVDMDDTLVKKSAMNELLLRIVSSAERDALEKHNAERIAAIHLGNRGEIYDPSKHLVDPDKTFAELVGFARQKREDYIYGDAERLLGRLDPDNTLVFSFGAKQYQMAKFAALASMLPIHITENPDKTQLLKDGHDGISYRVGNFVAQRIVFIDDREYSFNGFGELPNARGILLDRSDFANSHADDHRDPSNPLPGNVITVKSLDEINL